MNTRFAVLGSLMLGLSGGAFGHDGTSLTKEMTTSLIKEMTRTAGLLGVQVDGDIPPPQLAQSAPVLGGGGHLEAVPRSHPKKRIFPGSCDMDTTVHFFSGFPADEATRIINGIGLGLLQNAGKYTPGAKSFQGVSCATAEAMKECLELHEVCVPAQGSPYVFGVHDPEARGHVTRHIVLLIGISKDEQSRGLESVIQNFLKGQGQR